MFCTLADATIPIPPGFDGRSEACWSFVVLPLFVPYFQVVCRSGLDNTEERVQTICFSSFAQVMSAIADPDVKIYSVQLVNPGYMNGTGIWQIDILESVYRGVELHSRGHKQFAHVYVISNSARMLESSIAASEYDLTDVELVCDLTSQCR